MVSLSELTSSAPRVAFVGMAKNSGKTEALAATIRELGVAGRRIAVTSVGRDGERHDVLDRRIPKPRIELARGSLVATTAALLHASGVRARDIESTRFRTPLGDVVIAELLERGAIEVVGPGGAQHTGALATMLLARGAEQVLIDGAIDRRAAASPDIADGSVLSTGAVVHDQVDEIVRRTQRAVELMRMACVADDRVARLARAAGGDVLIDDDYEAVGLPVRFALGGSRADVAALLRLHPSARALIVPGALRASFLDHVVAARPRDAVTIVVSDPTKVFLEARGCSWYEEHGVDIRSLRPGNLLAVTVNPLAGWPHPVAAHELRRRLEVALEDVPVIDVRDPAYVAREDAHASSRS